MKRLATLALVWLSMVAQASPAQDLFDDASELFQQNYYGWQAASRSDLVARYRQILTQKCSPDPETCSYDTGRSVLKDMFDEFRDAHTSIRDAEGAERLREVQDNLSVPRTGLNIVKKPQGLLVVSVQQGSPAARWAMQAGDLLTRVNGKTAGDQQSVDNLAFVRLERQNAPITVVYQRKGREYKATLQPTVMQARDLPMLSFPSNPNPAMGETSAQTNPEKVALISLPSFLPQDSAALFLGKVEEARKQGASALIVDLRYNTGGRLDQCVAAASIFKPVVYQAKFEVGGWTFAGAQGESVLPMMTQMSNTKPIWTGPAAVLVGQDTASCAEVFAYYARKNGVKIIGESTKGVANSGINFYPLPDSGVLSLTTLRAYDEQGQPLPDHITPDIVAPTDLGKLVQQGEDTTLEAALKLLEGVLPAEKKGTALAHAAHS